MSQSTKQQDQDHSLTLHPALLQLQQPALPLLRRHQQLPGQEHIGWTQVCFPLVDACYWAHKNTWWHHIRNVLCQSQLSILQPSVRRGAEPSPRLVPHHRQLCHPRSRLPPRCLCLHRREVWRLFCFFDFNQMYQLLTNAFSRCCIRDYKPVSPM